MVEGEVWKLYTLMHTAAHDAEAPVMERSPKDGMLVLQEFDGGCVYPRLACLEALARHSCVAVAMAFFGVGVA